MAMKRILARSIKTSWLCPLAVLCAGYASGQHNAGSKTTVPDKELLAKFRQVCHQLDDFRGNYTMSGVVIINDQSSPGKKIDKADFVFCKDGDEFYYKMGKMITINEQGLYLSIDMAAKTIMVSPQKQVNYDTRLKQFADVGNTIQSENYEMKNAVTGNEQTISLINEHHITCKQYSITFDKRTLRIRRLYARLTNLQNPSSADNDEIVDVSINRWDHTADLTEFLMPGSIIKNTNGRWTLKSEYKGYRLIDM